MALMFRSPVLKENSMPDPIQDFSEESEKRQDDDTDIQLEIAVWESEGGLIPPEANE
jgi:hypothetical protein